MAPAWRRGSAEMGVDIAFYMMALLVVMILLGFHIAIALGICSALGV